MTDEEKGEAVESIINKLSKKALKDLCYTTVMELILVDSVRVGNGGLYWEVNGEGIIPEVEPNFED